MVNPQRVSRGIGRTDWVRQFPPTFCMEKPMAMMSNTARAMPRSPLRPRSSTPPAERRTSRMEPPKAISPNRYTSDPTPRASYGRPPAPRLRPTRGMESPPTYASPRPTSNCDNRQPSAAVPATALNRVRRYVPSRPMCRSVAIPTGLANTAPASPTSAAPAPCRPALRTEPGRLRIEGGDDCASSGPPAARSHTANAAVARAASAKPDDIEPGRHRGRERCAAALRELEPESLLARQLHGQEIVP